MIVWRLRLYQGYVLLALLRPVAPFRLRHKVEAAADALARIHAMLDGDGWALRA